MLVIAHPSDPKWEATVNGGSPLLEPAEIDAIEAFVRDGGGLIVLGETEEDKYGANLNELLGRFELAIDNATLQDYVHHLHDAPSWVLAALDQDGGPAGRRRARRSRGAPASTAPAPSVPRTAPASSPARTRAPRSPGAPLAAAAMHGAGRVVVTADSDLFGDDCIGELDHEQLWLNLVHWVARPAFADAPARPESPATADPAWTRLKAAVEELRLTQAADGSVDTAEHDPDKLRNLVARSPSRRRR